MNHRENMLQAVRFERPAYIPMSFHINPACWHAYPQDALQELMTEHPFLFPDFEPSSVPIVPQYGPNQRTGRPYTNDWGFGGRHRDQRRDVGLPGSLPINSISLHFPVPNR